MVFSKLNIFCLINCFTNRNVELDFDPCLESAGLFWIILYTKSCYIEKYNFNSYIIYELVYLRSYMYLFM